MQDLGPYHLLFAETVVVGSRLHILSLQSALCKIPPDCGQWLYADFVILLTDHTFPLINSKLDYC